MSRDNHKESRRAATNRNESNRNESRSAESQRTDTNRIATNLKNRIAANREAPQIDTRHAARLPPLCECLDLYMFVRWRVSTAEEDRRFE